MKTFPAIGKIFGLLSLLAVSLTLPSTAISAAPSLVPQALMQRAQADGEVRVLVRLHNSQTPATSLESAATRSQRRAGIRSARDGVLAGLGAVRHRVVREFEDIPFVALETGMDGLQVLESLSGGVAEVLEDRLHRPLLAESVPLMQADQAWAGAFAGTPLDGTGTVVAIIDTGVDQTHPFLSGKVVGEACFSSTRPIDLATSFCPGGASSSFASGSAMPCNVPDCEHGTHVAGIAAGDGQSGAVAAFSGVAKGADIMAVQVFSRFVNPTCASVGIPSPCAFAYDSDIMAGLQNVYNQRAVLNLAAVNMSLGGQTFRRRCNSDPLKPVIDLLRSAGIATVIASGNDGEPKKISSPACISSAVSVGSTDDGSTFMSFPTIADTVSFFSNGASFLSLLAPGIWITSSIPGGGFDTIAGTSMATPHVTGAFAILKEAAPTATVSQMLSALQRTGLPVTDTRTITHTTKPRIRILDALGQLPAVQFSSADYMVSEGSRRIKITLKRTGVPIDKLTVDYATSDGTAVAGADYGAVSGTLTFGPRATSKSFTIPIINDTVAEPNKTINLTLSNPIGGRLGAVDTAIVTITDND